MQLAFVIKNYVPYSCKVLLFSQKDGKIICMFSKTDQAALLTSGSLIWCQTKKTQKLYGLQYLEIESQIDSKNLVFMHDIMRLCLFVLPFNIACAELFDFLLFVHANSYRFDDKAEQVVFLRLFLMLDLLPDDVAMYQAAILDPTTSIEPEQGILESYVASCWNNFYQSKFMEKIS